MKTNPRKRATPRLYLDAEAATDLMVSNPLSLRPDTVVREAVIFLMDNGLSAAPVVDDAGRPVGVLSRTDLVGRVEYAAARPSTDLDMRLEGGREVPAVVDTHRTRVRDIMSPDVVAVAPEAPADKVVAEMLDRGVHRLFVVGGDGVLTGVISFGDVLRHLRRRQPARRSPTGKRK